jgi:uncharacterized protein (TIRG00374 family)
VSGSLGSQEKGRARWRPYLQMAFGLLLSLICLVLAFWGVRWDVVAVTLSQVRMLLLLAAVCIEFLTFWAIAARWQRLFAPHQAPPRARLFEILNIAQLVNALLPAKLGPLIRAYLAGQGTSVGVAFALTTIVGEKILEGLSLLLVAVGLLPFVPGTGWLRSTAWASALMLLAALVLMVWLAFRQQTANRWMERVLSRWPRLLKPAQSALAALDVWRNGRAVAALVGWSTLIWAITVLLNQLLLLSLGIQVPPVVPVLLLVVLQIGVRLPSSPGSIGVFHYLAVLTLSLFGVEKSLALSYSVILHLVTYLPASLLGLYYLYRAGYSLDRLRQAAGSVPFQPSTLGGQGDLP